MNFQATLFLSLTLENAKTGSFKNTLCTDQEYKIRSIGSFETRNAFEAKRILKTDEIRQCMNSAVCSPNVTQKTKRATGLPTTFNKSPEEKTLREFTPKSRDDRIKRQDKLAQNVSLDSILLQCISLSVVPSKLNFSDESERNFRTS
jgi:hypothetical protein